MQLCPCSTALQNTSIYRNLSSTLDLSDDNINLNVIAEAIYYKLFDSGDNVVAKRPPSRSSNNFVKIVNEVLAKGLLNHYRLIEPIYSRPPSITKTKKHLPKWRIS